jgi:hypothetical protein
MASQTTPSTSRALSAASAFADEKEKLEFIQALVKDVIDLRNTVDAFIELFNLHTHVCDGSEASTYNSSGPDTGGGDIAEVEAMAIATPATIKAGI